MFYAAARAILIAAFHLVFRVKITGAENIPATGKFILCANHISLLDPPLLIAKLKRRLTFIAKAELFKKKFPAWVFRRMGAISVDRGAADMSAFRASMACLKGGGALCVFITGRRMKEFDESQVKSGAALFAQKSGSPVIPVGITAGYRPFSRVTVNIGAPVDLTAYSGARVTTDQLNEMAAKITGRIKELL